MFSVYLGAHPPRLRYGFHEAMADDDFAAKMIAMQPARPNEIICRRLSRPWVRGGVLILLAVALFVSGLYPARAAEPPLRIALTAAAVRDQLPVYDRWAAYLERKIGRPVQFVQRRSYRDAIEMLRTGELDFSWVCSYSFLQAWDAGLVDLVATPLFHGKPAYRAYIVANRESAANKLADLEGKVFAYTDPDSNTGYIVPRAMIRDNGGQPDHFFRQVFFTWDHEQAIEAVAEKVADGAAVDSYIWECTAASRPQLAERTKVIEKSVEFAFPPVVARRGMDPKLRDSFAAALLGMAKDEEGRRVLDELMLDGFVSLPITQYDSVRAIVLLAQSSSAEQTRDPAPR